MRIFNHTFPRRSFPSVRSLVTSIQRHFLVFGAPSSGMASSSTAASPSTALAVASAVLTTAVVSYCVHRISLNRHVSEWQEKRAAERKGRIRAEVKLRTALKQQQRSSTNTTKDNTFTLKQIGTVRSPFTKRMGTPRQGALAPSSRGYIEFSHDIQPAALEGMEQYSHVWVVFQFHANTDLVGESRKSKIKPPRAPVKVGMLSTRSPHRPNPIGLSLVKFERLQGRRLYISALDLVNGTPIYDVKPCVPWDIPGFGLSNCDSNVLIVPEWVSQQDALPQVEFTTHASAALKELMSTGNVVSQAYEKTEFELVKSAIQEILAQDPRSGHKRGTATTDMPYNILFGSAQVEFVVESSGNVQVVGTRPAEFPEEAYVDGIPLASEAANVVARDGNCMGGR